jgi:hypothetical protein
VVRKVTTRLQKVNYVTVYVGSSEFFGFALLIAVWNEATKY